MDDKLVLAVLGLLILLGVVLPTILAEDYAAVEIVLNKPGIEIHIDKLLKNLSPLKIEDFEGRTAYAYLSQLDPRVRIIILTQSALQDSRVSVFTVRAESVLAYRTEKVYAVRIKGEISTLGGTLERPKEAYTARAKGMVLMLEREERLDSREFSVRIIFLGERKEMIAEIAAEGISKDDAKALFAKIFAMRPEEIPEPELQTKTIIVPLATGDLVKKVLIAELELLVREGVITGFTKDDIKAIRFVLEKIQALQGCRLVYKEGRWVPYSTLPRGVRGEAKAFGGEILGTRERGDREALIRASVTVLVAGVSALAIAYLARRKLGLQV